MEPDVEVLISPDDWAAGRDPQLETAVRLALEALEKQPPAMPPGLPAGRSKARPPLPPREPRPGEPRDGDRIPALPARPRRPDHLRGRRRRLARRGGGGRAWRLSADGTQVSHPRFSRDGTQIAWTSWRDGNPEVYASDTAGGDAARLTFWGDPQTRVTGWTADGDVLVISAAGQQAMKYRRAFAVPVPGTPRRGCSRSGRSTTCLWNRWPPPC